MGDRCEDCGALGVVEPTICQGCGKLLCGGCLYGEGAGMCFACNEKVVNEDSEAS